MDEKHVTLYQEMADLYAPLYNYFLEHLPDTRDAEIARERLTEARLWFTHALVNTPKIEEVEADVV